MSNSTDFPGAAYDRWKTTEPPLDDDEPQEDAECEHCGLLVGPVCEHCGCCESCCCGHDDDEIRADLEEDDDIDW